MGIKQRSEEADLYIPLKFEGLKSEDIEYLSASGVKRITLYSILNGSPKQQALAIKRSYLIPLEEGSEDKYRTYILPIQEGFSEADRRLLAKSEPDYFYRTIQDGEYGFNGSEIGLFIIIIIIIVIVLWAYKTAGYKKK